MAPQIQSVEVARYRGFRDAQQWSLGRLTLFYGENNAGKSALLRALPVLAESRTPGRAGLALGDPVRRAAFREVQWRGGVPSGEDDDVVLGLGLSDGTSWKWTFRWLPRGLAVIQEVAVSQGAEPVVFVRADLEAPDPKDVEYTGTNGAQRLQFDGIIPRPGTHPLVDGCRDGLIGALEGVVWLSATRKAPAREGTAVGAPGFLTGNGEGAAALLLADEHLRAEVSRWFEKHTRHRVTVASLGSELRRLVLDPLQGAAIQIPFPDAGEGLQQVFPVVVALAHLRRAGGTLCVEEPEGHLHPRLQKGLAELIVEVLSEQPSASVVLETHSELFLVAALTAALKPLAGAVRLFWVETSADGLATIESIPLDETGRPTTPRLEQAFATMGAMERDLIQARRSGRDATASSSKPLGGAEKPRSHGG
ncbi:AAA family ATPase [Sorangium sp. So ce128]|uniref:AAA family ATPase n=1 Tax=Sorangium sp. So ce128 TaxID=3133281 RepID=UPI003F5FC8E9